MSTDADPNAGHQTLCETIGHDWQWYKAYGQNYMQCERCKRTRPLTKEDIRKVWQQ